MRPPEAADQVAAPLDRGFHIALAALGCLRANGRAHATEGFKELSAGFVNKVEAECGSIECSALMERYRKEDTRCLDTVLRIADALDAYLRETE